MTLPPDRPALGAYLERARQDAEAVGEDFDAWRRHRVMCRLADELERRIVARDLAELMRAHAVGTDRGALARRLRRLADELGAA